MIYLSEKGSDTVTEVRRCVWCRDNHPRYLLYHDTEWGRLTLDEGYLFEMLILECFQAGLSWECVLNKREAFRRSYRSFDAVTVASFTEDTVNEMMNDPAIIRNRRKIEASIRNAAVFLKLQKEFGSFSAYLLSFFKSYPIRECGKTTSAVSDTLSRDLNRRGMSFIGSTTVYSYLSAIGLINAHDADCFLAEPLKLPSEKGI